MMSTPAELDIVLTFDGDRWCTHVNDQTLTASSIVDLESRIISEVQHMPCFADYPTIQVRLNCDTSVLPAWLRQYHAHYFNSTLTITKPVSQATGLPA